MKEKFKLAFMDCAERFAQLSTAKKLQVGSIIVKDNRIISIGYNGMPSGWDNECEHLGKSKPEVLHAEANAITKVARSSENCEDSVIFCTHMPCIECAKIIYQSGISKVYYKEDYNAAKGTGKPFLQECDIELEQVFRLYQYLVRY
jgi:dCMP deaminase